MSITHANGDELSEVSCDGKKVGYPAVLTYLHEAWNLPIKLNRLLGLVDMGEFPLDEGERNGVPVFNHLAIDLWVVEQFGPEDVREKWIFWDLYCNGDGGGEYIPCFDHEKGRLNLRYVPFEEA